MNLNFQGRVAFVTGAGSGIGRAAALAFAREGAYVIATDLSVVSTRETVHMIEAAGGRGLAIRCDVTQTGDVQAALDRAFQKFGRLDFAFNNAGSEQPVIPTADPPNRLGLELLTSIPMGSFNWRYDATRYLFTLSCS